MHTDATVESHRSIATDGVWKILKEIKLINSRISSDQVERR